MTPPARFSCIGSVAPTKRFARRVATLIKVGVEDGGKNRRGNHGWKATAADQGTPDDGMQAPSQVRRNRRLPAPRPGTMAIY